jgi:hypothetical protein
MRVRALLVVTIAVVTLVGCGSSRRTTDAGPGSGSNGPHDLIGITINPTNPIVEVDLNTVGMLPLAAVGNYSDGSSEDLSDQVTWTVDNPAVGAITGAVLHTPMFAMSTAVVSKVTATFTTFSGIAQVTVVAYRRSGPQQDFFFVLPYQDPSGDQTKPLDFSTAVPGLDVFFTMDTTGSMGGEISNLETSLNTVVTPGIRTQVADSQFGVGSLQDFPLDGHGEPGCDQPFRLLQPITSNLTDVATGVNALSSSGSPIGCGDDLPEAGIETIYQAASGNGLAGPSPTSVPANHTGIGGVGFRQGTLPVIVTITDAISHGVGETATCDGESVAYEPDIAAFAHSRAQTKDALNAICSRSVGIAPTGGFDSCDGVEFLEYFATATGARVPPAAWDLGGRPAGCAAGQCCTNFNGTGRAADAEGLCPLVFLVDTNGTGVSQSIVTGIQMLTRFATFTVPTEHEGVTTDIDGNPLPAPHNTADFLKSIVPESYLLPPAPPIVPAPSFDNESFFSVTPGTVVTFGVDAFNDFVPQTDQPQIFRATIRVNAGSTCTITLDQRDVLILVPPIPIVVQ